MSTIFTPRPSQGPSHKLTALLSPLASGALLLGALSALAPSSASACGGLFCNPNAPVNQQAERILFAQDPDEPELMQMHVRLIYQGEAERFSWLLPVPPNTRFELSREAMFNVLDSNFAPMFTLNRVTEGECDEFGFDQGVNGLPDVAGAEAGASIQDPGVQVTSREEVGPYDKVTLRATDVGLLIEWLNENGFDQPEGTEAVLEPYLADYEFLAIKLRTDDSSSVSPVMLTFRGDLPTIPMRPTSVAANPDMGVIVHLLGASRAVPSNFTHVEINDSAIDWLNQGSNYSDVVSQAVDEAPNHQAFTTDFAGPHNLNSVLEESLPSYIAERFESVTTLQELSNAIFELAVEGRLNDRDFSVFFRQALIDVGLEAELVSELLNINIFCDFECFPEMMNARPEWMETAFDAGPLLSEISAFYEQNSHINNTFNTHAYLSRLYTTLSADEMNADPSFFFNVDLEPVDRTRTATLYQTCNGQPIRLITPSELEIDMSGGGPELIARQDGETVRGTSVPGAAVIERTMSAGQSEVITDNRPGLEEEFAPRNQGGEGGAGGAGGQESPTAMGKGEESALFGCAQRSDSSAIFGLLFAFIALMIGSRRVRA